MALAATNDRRQSRGSPNVVLLPLVGTFRIDPFASCEWTSRNPESPPFASYCRSLRHSVVCGARYERVLHRHVPNFHVKSGDRIVSNSTQLAMQVQDKLALGIQMARSIHVACWGIETGAARTTCRSRSLRAGHGGKTPADNKNLEMVEMGQVHANLRLHDELKERPRRTTNVDTSRSWAGCSQRSLCHGHDHPAHVGTPDETSRRLHQAHYPAAAVTATVKSA
jgi:hypothetical protein